MVIAVIAALAVVALLAWARGDPAMTAGSPDPEDAASVERSDEAGSTGRARRGEAASQRAAASTEPAGRARIPMVVLVVLLALTIVLFGIDATDGPLQVALLASAAFAGLVAMKNGYTSTASVTPPSAASARRWGRSSSCSPSAP